MQWVLVPAVWGMLRLMLRLLMVLQCWHAWKRRGLAFLHPSWWWGAAGSSCLLPPGTHLAAEQPPALVLRGAVLRGALGFLLAVVGLVVFDDVVLPAEQGDHPWWGESINEHPGAESAELCASWWRSQHHPCLLLSNRAPQPSVCFLHKFLAKVVTRREA